MNFIFKNDDITYNLETENGVIAVRPTFTTPKKIKEFIEVLGATNLLTKDLGVYESREITIPLSFLTYDINNFKLFLLEGMRGKLYFPNYFPTTYFEVEDVYSIAVDDNYEVGEATITFVCNSFRKSEEKSISITNQKIFNIEGTIDTKPVFEIKATADVSISINNENIKIKNVEGSIVLDFEKLEFYKKNTDGSLVQQGNKLNYFNMKKIKLFVNKQNNISINGATECLIKYKENYI